MALDKEKSKGSTDQSKGSADQEKKDETPTASRAKASTPSSTGKSSNKSPASSKKEENPVLAEILKELKSLSNKTNSMNDKIEAQVLQKVF